MCPPACIDRQGETAVTAAGLTGHLISVVSAVERRAKRVRSNCLFVLPYYPAHATSVVRAERDLPVTLKVACSRLRGLGLTTICTSLSSAFR